MRRMSTVRRMIERDYGLEEGELDGVRMKEIYEIVGAEDGALDRYKFVPYDEEEEE